MYLERIVPCYLYNSFITVMTYHHSVLIIFLTFSFKIDL